MPLTNALNLEVQWSDHADNLPTSSRPTGCDTESTPVCRDTGPRRTICGVAPSIHFDRQIANVSVCMSLSRLRPSNQCSSWCITVDRPESNFQVSLTTRAAAFSTQSLDSVSGGLGCPPNTTIL